MLARTACTVDPGGAFRRPSAPKFPARRVSSFHSSRSSSPGLHLAQPQTFPPRHVPNTRCQAAYADPDDYEHDLGYDSDDYEPLIEAAAAPRRAAQAPSAVSPPSHSASAAPFRPPLPPAWQPDPAVFTEATNRSTRQAIKASFTLLLVFGAAVDRGMSALFQLLRRTAVAAKKQAQVTHAMVRDTFRSSSVGQKVEKWQLNASEMQRELPEDTWGKLLWLWDRPQVQRIRLTVSMANLSIRLPALLALIATQVGLLASQVSLPMLAPLLLGTGMLLRSIKANASFLLPRIGLLVVMLWLLWFANSVVQNTALYLRKQGALDHRLAGGIVTVSECSTLLVAMVVLLSMLGVNVSALLLPAGIAAAVAAKDLSHNFLAGLFLFVVQPFKMGDRVSVASSVAGAGGGFGGSGPGWFEGVCEKIDLRYTIVRQGRRRLMVPNSAFITREFMVVDDGPAGETAPPPTSTTGSSAGGGEAGGDPGVYHVQSFLTNDHRHVWQYVQGPPVHSELAMGGQYPPSQWGEAPQQAQRPLSAPGNEHSAPREPAVAAGEGGSNGAINGVNGGGSGSPASAARGGGATQQQPHRFQQQRSSGAAEATMYGFGPPNTSPSTGGGVGGDMPPPPPPPGGYYTRVASVGGDGGGLGHPMGVNSGPTSRVVNGYWQPLNYGHSDYNTLRSHPLSPEPWHQQSPGEPR